MDNPEEQLRQLKMRVRNLERSLAESEALSLEQIECTHRLEQQLFATQAQLETRHQELDVCRQENQHLAQRPTQEDLERQNTHIQELQSLIWDLERRPTLEQVRILQQQVETSQAEIEMLKLELGRRVDPERFYQLQQELTELKNYANQLGDYAARLPQIQLQHAQSQLQSHQLETELVELKEKLKEMEKRPSPTDVEARIQTIQDHYQSTQIQLQNHLKNAQFQIEQLQTQLSVAESEREALLQELSDQSYTDSADHDQRIPTLNAEIEQLKAQIADSDHLKAELQQAREKLEELEQRPSLEQVEKRETQFQQLHQQVHELQQERDELEKELERRPSQEEISQLHQEVKELRSQWQEAETQQHELQSEIAQRPQLAELTTLQHQIQQLQDRLSTLEDQNAELSRRPTQEQLQEAQRRQELAEAHHVVSQKQINKLQKQIDDLKAECVQAHAYAQTQEKEVALLERQKQDLQDQLVVLTQHQAAQSQPSRHRDPVPTRAHSPRSPITVIASESEPASHTAQQASQRSSNNPDRIPTFSVEPEENTPDLLRRHSLIKLTSKSQSGSQSDAQAYTPPQPSPRPRSPRVDLPSFVRRSP